MGLIRVSRSQRLLAAVVLGVLGLGVVFGCNSKGTTPTPAKYYLYAGMFPSWPEQPSGFVAIIDCEADSVVDSLTGGIEIDVTPFVSASSDGKYLASYPTANAVRIWDAATREPIIDLPMPRGMDLPLFLPDAGLMLIPVRDSTFVYGVPGFTLDTIIHVELLFPAHIPGRTRVIGMERRRGIERDDYSKLNIFDYGEMEVVDSVIIDPDSLGFGWPIISYDVSPDGQQLYARCVDRDHNRLLVRYDLENHHRVFESSLSLRNSAGSCRVSPDGSEVWISGSFNCCFPMIVDTPELMIFDAATGSELGTIELRGFFTGNPDKPLTPVNIRFHPDGGKAYVGCGGLNPEPIVVVDVVSREVVKLIYGEFDNLTWSIDLAPRP